jgi:hypothetical protein
MSQDLHAQGSGSSSAPVQPSQEQLEFLGGLDRRFAVRRGLPVRRRGRSASGPNG